jgi:hypothetical protein
MRITSRIEPRPEAVAIGKPFLSFPLIVKAGDVLPLTARVRSDDIPAFSRLKGLESEVHLIGRLHHSSHYAPTFGRSPAV